MDLKTMEYYLAVVREGSITAAAEALHLSQPALSRKMKDLEDELGVVLFRRGKRRVTLTDEGIILRRRADEMIRLMAQTERDIEGARKGLTGEVNIGAGESAAFHILSGVAGDISREYPGIRFSVTSGDTEDLMDQLSGGLLDLALIFSGFDRDVYQYIRLPVPDRFVVLMRKDCSLAAKERIRPEDLRGVPVMISRAEAPSFMGADAFKALDVFGTYNLIYNASLMVEDMGCCAICFDGLVDTGDESPLCFRPLEPGITVYGSVIWKRYQPLSPAARIFMDRLRDALKKMNTHE